MTDLLSGWKPSSRVRRRVVLPEWLDRRVAQLAEDEDETLASFVTAVLSKAVSGSASTQTSVGRTQANGHVAATVTRTHERRVRRTLMLEPSVNDALNAYVYNSQIELSELTTAILSQLITSGSDQGNPPGGSGLVHDSSTNGTHA